MNNEQFQNILAHNQQLMLSEEYERLTTPIEKRFGKKGGSDSTMALYEQQYLAQRDGNIAPSSMSTQSAPKMIPTTNRKLNENSKIPSVIKESFKKKPAMSGDGVQYANGDNTTNTNQFFASAQGQMMTEQKIATTPQNYNTQGGNVDYSIIKAIVNECIKENLNEIKKTMLNENTMKGLRLGKGNKIQFIDNKGNLFEGVLNLKKKKE